MENTTSQKCIQIILSHVPFKNNTTKSITFTKCTTDKQIYFSEIFEYLEYITQINKRYFTLTIGKKNINYVNLFYTRTHSSKTFNASGEFIVLNVSIDINADKKILAYHTSLLRTIKKEYKKEMLKELFKYTTLKFNSNNYILIEYYKLLFSFELFTNNLCQTDLLTVKNNLFYIINNHKNYSYNDLEFTQNTLNNYCRSII